ncbi:hypothetical protein NL527_28555, partial [Klebsiella pneumoniae]|nr:hypothetical protein [Klebsiella pneumoniae]
LTANCAALYMVIIDKSVFDSWGSPVTTPDYFIVPCQLAQQGEITFPRWFAVNTPYNIAG